MSYIDRSHLNPNRRYIATTALAVLLSLNPGCNEPSSIFRSLKACVIGNPDITRINGEVSSVMLRLRTDDFGDKRVSALGEEAENIVRKFYPATRVRLNFRRTDTSLIHTGFESKRRRLERELMTEIVKGQEYPIMDTPEASNRLELIETFAASCTG